MRSDGTRVKKADILYTVVPHVMSQRVDSMNMITVDIPIDPVNSYINEKRKQGIGISNIAVLLSAYIRAVREMPLLNRFVVNRKIYDRNEFCVAMVVLKPGKAEDDSTMSKIYFTLDDTIFDVQNKIDAFFEFNTAAESTNSTDKLASFLGNANFLIRFLVNVIKFWDKHFGLPKKIVDMSPFHSSLTITNLASIRTNHIYHHVYEFGTTSIFIAMGNLREVPMREKGEIVFKRCMPLGVVMDERICSGGYFAKALRIISKYMRDPAMMEIPATTALPAASTEQAE